MKREVVSEGLANQAMQKIRPIKHLRKWIEYTHLLRAKGLKNRQMEPVKIFISQEVKSTSDWTRKACVAQQTLSRWFNHDELFQQCLADTCDVYLNVVILFGIVRFAQKVAQGDVRALNLVLKLRGKIEPDKRS